MASDLPSERSLIAALAAHTKWAGTPDRQAATAAARKAFDDRFEKLVDPTGEMDPATRATLAESRKRAYFRELSLKSAQVRRARKATHPQSRSA